MPVLLVSRVHRHEARRHEERNRTGDQRSSRRLVPSDCFQGLAATRQGQRGVTSFLTVPHETFGPADSL